ncbi:MAG: hypothetical protein C0483_26235 [Pirellula sp.]|nr:hypothetical protein [Pirellula sp.]
MSENIGIIDPAVMEETLVLRSRNTMRKFQPSATSPVVVLIAGTALALGAAWPLTGKAQDQPDKAKAAGAHAQHQATPPSGAQKHDMGAMGGAKQAEWWYENYTRGQKQGMAGMSGMQGMTQDDTNAGSKAGKNSPAGVQMKNDEAGIMGMRNSDTGSTVMGAVGGAGSMNMTGMSELKTASSQPGIPGVSRIYHIGATGFFLDHAEHVTLSTKQQAELNVVQQKALLSQATARRKIDEAEQQLWELTGADDPDIAKIQATVEDIEKLRGGQRLALIRSVAEAARLLTEEQRAVLLGTKEPDAIQADAPVVK